MILACVLVCFSLSTGCTEIGMLQGCSKESVYESIQAVRRKFLKFFSNNPDNRLF
jgi:hypothetical protein